MALSVCEQLGALPSPCDLSSQLLSPTLAARASVHAQPRGKVLKPLVSEFAQVVTLRGPSAFLPSGTKLAAAFVVPSQVQAFPQVPFLPAGSKCVRAFPLGVDVGPTAPTKVLPASTSASDVGHAAPTKVLPASASASASASAKVVPVKASATPAHSASPTADAPAGSFGGAPAHSASSTADAPTKVLSACTSASDVGPAAPTKVLPASASASASASAKVVPVHASATPAHSASPTADAPAGSPMGPLTSPSPSGLGVPSAAPVSPRLSAGEERTFGVPWTPEQFVQKASNARHPRDLLQCIPIELKESIDYQVSSSPAEVAKSRTESMRRWVLREGNPRA